MYCTIHCTIIRRIRYTVLHHSIIISTSISPRVHALLLPTPPICTYSPRPTTVPYRRGCFHLSLSHLPSTTSPRPPAPSLRTFSRPEMRSNRHPSPGGTRVRPASVPRAVAGSLTQEEISRKDDNVSDVTCPRHMLPVQIQRRCMHRCRAVPRLQNKSLVLDVRP